MRLLKNILREILRKVLYKAYKAGYYDSISHKAIDEGFTEYIRSCQ